MKHVIIGTAGHIDHGKTTLIEALTGRNPDRLEEEKRRGITIDLGFTYFDLENGNRAGVIDVPGHERFINHMAAGVPGMDLVLLVVAADEGIMPQTREHIAILELLGVKKSILVLNKCDLADEEWLELAEEEIRSTLEGTFLQHAPVVRVSAVTGQGIPELKKLISGMTGEVEEKNKYTVARMPIDRVFSLSGFGTIVTGTILSGSISKEDKLQLYPSGSECKIRNIQVHNQDVDKAYAGQRAALNISNVKKSDIKRGNVLAPPASMKNSKLMDVKLEILKASSRVLTNQSRVHFFSGTSEVLCRTILLDKESLGPGESGFAQLRMEEENAFRRGDRFVIRFYSPMETIGGGVILDPNAEKRKRFQEETIQYLRQKETGTPEEVLKLQLERFKDAMVSVSELAELTSLSRKEIEEDTESLRQRGEAVVFAAKKETYVWHTKNEEICRRRVISAISDYVGKNPYRRGIAKAEIHSSYLKKMKKNMFDLYVEYLTMNRLISRDDEFLAPAGYHPAHDEIYYKVQRLLFGAIKPARYDFVRMADISFGNIPQHTVEDIVLLLADEGRIVKIAEGVYTVTGYMDEARDRVMEKLKRDGKITIAEVRDMFETSRKSAKPILEYMDSIKVTRKTGAESERVPNL